VAARLREDPHRWASALYDEVRALGYPRSYVTFARQIRLRGLRPHCEACAGVKGRPTIEIPHPPGAEIQWDWLGFEQTPWGEKAYLLNGTLSYSSKTRGVFAESEDQPHLVEAIDGVLRRLGGTARRWRFDRMSTVVSPNRGRLLASFAEVARYYGVAVDICPPRRGNRKGAVEKQNHFSAQRWWRTARISNLAQAQAAYDRFQETIGDHRGRRGRPAVELAEDEHLLPLPVQPFPSCLEVERSLSDSALVAFRGNLSGVGPGLVGATVKVRLRLGSDAIAIVSATGSLLAEHRLEPAGAGVIRRLPGQREALEAALLSAFTTRPPCRGKENRPPGPEAVAAARKLLDMPNPDVTVDLERYARLAGVRP
jgi:transposase